jgi:hypothetical protein
MAWLLALVEGVDDPREEVTEALFAQLKRAWQFGDFESMARLIEPIAHCGRALDAELLNLAGRDIKRWLAERRSAPLEILRLERLLAQIQALLGTPSPSGQAPSR